MHKALHGQKRLPSTSGIHAPQHVRQVIHWLGPWQIDLLARWNRLDIPPSLELANRDPWWETVDGLAAMISDVLLQDRQNARINPSYMLDALSSKQMRSRRIAMTHQIGWKAHTDEKQLFRYATTLTGGKEFFIHKAIGWALRDYAKTAPSAVKTFLSRPDVRPPTLSAREAMKHL